jgi:hypothetical protein
VQVQDIESGRDLWGTGRGGAVDIQGAWEQSVLHTQSYCKLKTTPKISLLKKRKANPV